MKKKYRKLTKDQKERGIVFSSQLRSNKDNPAPNSTIHEVSGSITQGERCRREMSLKDDKFFNDSPWDYNEIRQ